MTYPEHCVIVMRYSRSAYPVCILTDFTRHILSIPTEHSKINLI